MDGKLLCWLCTMSYRRVLAKGRHKDIGNDTPPLHRSSSSAALHGSNSDRQTESHLKRVSSSLSLSQRSSSERQGLHKSSSTSSFSGSSIKSRSLDASKARGSDLDVTPGHTPERVSTPNLQKHKGDTPDQAR